MSVECHRDAATFVAAWLPPPELTLADFVFDVYPDLSTFDPYSALGTRTILVSSRRERPKAQTSGPWRPHRAIVGQDKHRTAEAKGVAIDAAAWRCFPK